MRRTVGLAAIACVMLGTMSAPRAATRYLDPVFAVSKTSNLVYGSAFNSRTNSMQRLVLDLYEPRADASTARPAIVWVHGGWFSGGRRTDPGSAFFARAFAARGYVTVSIDYRTLQPYGGPETKSDLYVGTWIRRSPVIDAAQHDAQAAVRWLRANAKRYRIDRSRIAIGGMSAGAITALQVAYNPESPGNSGNRGYSSAVGAVISVSGFAAARDLGPGGPPALMFHGANDTVIPFPLHAYTCALATLHGSGCEQVVYADGGHVGVRGEHGPQVVARTANFLCRVLLQVVCTAPAPAALQVAGVT